MCYLIRWRKLKIKHAIGDFHLKTGPLHLKGITQEACRIILGVLHRQAGSDTGRNSQQSKEQVQLLTAAMRVMWDSPQGHLAALAGAGRGCLP